MKKRKKIKRTVDRIQNNRTNNKRLYSPVPIHPDRDRASRSPSPAGLPRGAQPSNQLIIVFVLPTYSGPWHWKRDVKVYVRLKYTNVYSM